jgi:hypothetical protein
MKTTSPFFVFFDYFEQRPPFSLFLLILDEIQIIKNENKEMANNLHKFIQLHLKEFKELAEKVQER